MLQVHTPSYGPISPANPHIARESIACFTFAARYTPLRHELTVRRQRSRSLTGVMVDAAEKLTNGAFAGENISRVRVRRGCVHERRLQSSLMRRRNIRHRDDGMLAREACFLTCGYLFRLALFPLPVLARRDGSKGGKVRERFPARARALAVGLIQD